MSNEFEELIKNFDDLNVGHRKVKVITGKDNEEVTRRAAEFEKLHNVVDSKQYTENVKFLFYME
ncbi:hypothetical protein [Clostridium omnivorum]|uniref:Uncharacterized protein n=1 Tax=Clostridium omnivorum TaxID=1604902 RepID=A0ABQ5NCK4_9CLOT|nr:hypothetical protein [Clostridium sp. E14]GLC32891.1 hypothetical protein bsdE14_43010 [Clostridium sp. E14]